MINLSDKSDCCGCNACVQCCPKQCIIMHEDEEGFLYPKIESSYCIHCGLCETVCPMLNQNEPRLPQKVYAAKNNNEKQRLQSSSGGIFILLAEQIIKQGGVVFGVRFNKNWEVEHCHAETIEELKPLMRSKYVQSNIGNTFYEAKKFLKQGRPVLFIGTSCQIAGLKKFLHKEYENLLAIDLICHGVPSPGVWKTYLEEIKVNSEILVKKNTLRPSSSKVLTEITNINFREKQLGGYSWEKYGFAISTKSQYKDGKNFISLSSPFNINPFMKGFLANLYLRPSCYKCPAKAGRSSSDLTIGDFWGINKFKPDFDDDKGVGAILVYTSKGEKILHSIDIELKQMNYYEVIEYNHSIHSSVSMPNRRKQFWKHYSKTHNIRLSVARTLKTTLKEKIKGKIIKFKEVLRKK